MRRKAVIACLEANEKRLYAIARAMMGNDQDALDMLSEASYQAYKRAGSIRSEQAVYKWLTTVLINCCRMELRKKRPQTQELTVNEYPTPDNTAQIDTQDMLERLPEEYKTIVMLRFFGEMTTREIASQINLPESTVRYRLDSALKALRLQLEEV